MSHNKDEMVQLFKDLDKDGGGVSIQELQRGIKEIFCQDLNNQCIVNMMMGFDADGDKMISEDEFISQMCDKLDRKVTFSKRFKEYDADGNGNLSRDEIKRLLDGLTNEDVAEQMINDCDQDSDGKITLEEFLRVMQ